MKFSMGLLQSWLLAFSLNVFVVITAMSADEPAGPTVGIEGKIVLMLPGTRLKTVPTDPKAPMTVRIADAQPRGTATQYDLRYIGQVPGTYDLRKYLAREGGSTTNDLPAIEVRVTGLLPADHQGQLAPRDEQRLPSLGGYRSLMIAVGIVWIGMIIPFWLSRRKAAAVAAEKGPAPLTMADRLRPLIVRATSGQISSDEKAQLERLLLGHWRERLSLKDDEPAAAMAQLRAHPEAGVLLRALEDWLHRPPGRTVVDLESFLAPYARAAPASPVSA